MDLRNGEDGLFLPFRAGGRGCIGREFIPEVYITRSVDEAGMKGCDEGGNVGSCVYGKEVGGAGGVGGDGVCMTSSNAIPPGGAGLGFVSERRGPNETCGNPTRC